MNITSFTPSQLREAANIKEQIEALEHELTNLTSSSPAKEIQVPKAKRGRPAKIKPPLVAEPAKLGPKKRGMSVAGKARIAAAQKLRWAKVHALKGGVKAEVAEKPGKRKMSLAGRAAIIAAQKARWAKIKAGKKA